MVSSKGFRLQQQASNLIIYYILSRMSEERKEHPAIFDVERASGQSDSIDKELSKIQFKDFEDRLDLEEARAALTDPDNLKTVPWEQVKKDLGL